MCYFLLLVVVLISETEAKEIDKHKKIVYENIYYGLIRDHMY